MKISLTIQEIYFLTNGSDEHINDINKWIRLCLIHETHTLPEEHTDACVNGCVGIGREMQVIRINICYFSHSLFRYAERKKITSRMFFFNQFSIFPRKPRFVLFVAFSVNSCCWLKAKDIGWLHLYLSYTIKIGTNACACVYLIIKWPGDTIIPSVVCIRFGAVLLLFFAIF